MMMKLLSLSCLSCTYTINMGIVLLVLLGSAGRQC